MSPALFLKDDKRAHGIAISVWDNSFDSTVNPADVDFIVVKATEGNFVDRNFEEYSQSIQQVPMRGAMHFFRGDVPWQEQVDFFLSTVKDKGFHFYTLDLEPTSERGSTTFLMDAKQWLAYVDERVEQKVLLPTLGSYMNSFGVDGNWMKEWPLLIMQYPLEPDRNGSPVLPTGVTDWKIWNYSDGRGMGKEYGVGGNDVYLEVYNGTPGEMWEWLEITSFSVFDRPSGNLTRLKRPIQVTGLNGIAFSPDGSYIAYAGDGKVSRLNGGSGEEMSTLFLGGRTILSVNFADDSKLSIGTEDGTVLLWDLGVLDVGTELEPSLIAGRQVASLCNDRLAHCRLHPKLSGDVDCVDVEVVGKQQADNQCNKTGVFFVGPGCPVHGGFKPGFDVFQGFLQFARDIESFCVQHGGKRFQGLGERLPFRIVPHAEILHAFSDRANQIL